MINKLFKLFEPFKPFNPDQSTETPTKMACRSRTGQFDARHGLALPIPVGDNESELYMPMTAQSFIYKKNRCGSIRYHVRTCVWVAEGCVAKILNGFFFIVNDKNANTDSFKV